MMKRPHLALPLALIAAYGCSDSRQGDGPFAPEFAKGSGTPTYPLAFTFTDDGTGVTSDGKAAVILGASVASSYANGECGVTATTSVTDVVADILPSGGSGKRSCVGRTIRVALDQPVQLDGGAGGPAFGTITTGTHIKLQGLATVTASSGPVMIDGGFNQLVGAGDCSGLRHNANFGGDRLQATRTHTRGVNGADRNVWLVETLPGADRAACVAGSGADVTVLRYYLVPVRFTVTQLTY